MRCWEFMIDDGEMNRKRIGPNGKRCSGVRLDLVAVNKIGRNP